jgi:hypothetical protein
MGSGRIAVKFCVKREATVWKMNLRPLKN